MSLLQLRFLTISRGLWRYKNWIARTIGWAVVVYLAVWATFYLVAGTQLALRDARVIQIPQLTQLIPIICGVAWLAVVFLPRVPQVILTRRDIIRLALAPILPVQVLAWGFWQQRLAWAMIGFMFGVFWWLFAPKLFDFHAPLAPLCLAFGFASSVDWRWLRYARRKEVWVFGAVLCLAVLGDVVGLTVFFSGLYASSSLALILPIVLWLSGFILVRQKQGYPARYFYLSNLLSDLQTMQANAFLLQRPLDTDSQMRRLALLFPSNQAVRSIPSPPVAWGIYGALAWRTALTLYRRSFWNWLRFIVWVALLGLFHHPIALGVLGLSTIQIWLWRATLPQLLGNSHDPKLPIIGLTRTWGRVTPGIVIIFVLAILGYLVIPTFGSIMIIIFLRGVSGLLLLEKFSVWLKLPPDSREASYAAATICFLPSFLSGNVLLEITAHGLLILLVALQKRF